MEPVATEQQIDELARHGIKAYLQVRSQQLLMGYFESPGDRELAWQASCFLGEYTVCVAQKVANIEKNLLLAYYTGNLGDTGFIEKIKEKIQEFRDSCTRVSDRTHTLRH